MWTRNALAAVARRRALPQLVDQDFLRDGLVWANCEEREQLARLGTGDGLRDALMVHFEGSKYANFHNTPATPSCEKGYTGSGVCVFAAPLRAAASDAGATDASAFAERCGGKGAT